MPEAQIPTDRPLTEGEVQALICECILKLGRRNGLIQAPQLVRVDSVVETGGLRGPEAQVVYELNKEIWTQRKLSEFVNRLIARGILSRAWEQSHSDVFYFVSEYGLTVLEDISSLLDFQATEFVEALQDPELRERCGDVLNRTKKHDSMIRDAIAVLEDRLKNLPGVNLSHRRREVAVNALSPTTGVCTLGDDDGQKESAQLLYQGVLGFFGNPVLHGLQDIDARQARQIVGFVDTLLALLREAQSRTP